MSNSHYNKTAFDQIPSLQRSPSVMQTSPTTFRENRSTLTSSQPQTFLIDQCQEFIIQPTLTLPSQCQTPQKFKESRIEYIPVQKYITEYQTQEIIEYIPKEKKIASYYAVEHQTEYHPRNIKEKYIQYIPVEKYAQRVVYQPKVSQVEYFNTQQIEQSVKNSIQNLKQTHFNPVLQQTTQEQPSISQIISECAQQSDLENISLDTSLNFSCSEIQSKPPSNLKFTKLI